MCTLKVYLDYIYLGVLKSTGILLFGRRDLLWLDLYSKAPALQS